MSVSAQHGLHVTTDDALFIADRLDELNSGRSQASARLAHLSKRLRSACASLTPTQEKTRPDRRKDLRGVPFDIEPRDYERYDVCETGEAAALLGCKPANVRDLIRRGKLPARWVGNRYVVSTRVVIERAERRAARRG